MPDKPGAVERAFQIADSSQVATVSEIKRVLNNEGYLAYEISGPIHLANLATGSRKRRPMANLPDRLKNPARRSIRRVNPPGDFGVIYLEEQDDEGRWNVSRSGVPTGA